MRRQERKRRHKWFMAALLLILVPTGAIFLIRFINLNTVFEKSLSHHLSPGLNVSIERAFLGLTRYGPAIRMQDVKVYRAPHAVAFEAKNAAITFDGWSALTGVLVPRALSVSDITIDLIEKEDGTLRLYALLDQKSPSSNPLLGQDGEQPLSFMDVFPLESSSSSQDALPFVAQIYSFADVLLGSEGFIGALEHINLRRIHVMRRELKSLKSSQEAITTLIDKGRLTLSRPKRKTPDSPRSAVLSLEADGDESPWSIFADLRGSSQDVVDVRMTFE